MINIHKAITTVMGLGYAPIAPGTFGTIGAVFCYYLLSLQYPNVIPVSLLLVPAVVLTIIGIWSTDKVIPLWGDDPSRVVIDEYVGYLITMAFVPVSVTNMFMGFVLFRFFDILKPFGIRYLDKNLKGGLGVMLDDVLAGIYACISLHLIINFLPTLLPSI